MPKLKKSKNKKQKPHLKKVDFLDSTAHEIRVLVNAILGFSKLLNADSLEEKQRGYLRSIVSSSELLRKIVSDILDFSKTRKGKLALERISFNLPLLNQDVFNIAKGRINKKPIRLDYHIQKDTPGHMIGDPTRLKQILLNLLDNALKFTEKGEVVLNVNLKFSSQKKRILCFSVRDTGIGISNKKDIFQSFTQAENSTTRKYGGTGLGLAITKSYVGAMGGKIWFESKLGEGTIFFVDLPFEVGKSAPERKEPETTLPLEGSCQGIKVLVVEDSIPNQDLMKAYFELMGCQGDFAVNGEEAITKIGKSSYDICFMDLQLPGIGGIEATEIIREKITRNLPIVALTASSESDKQKEYKDAGVTDHLGKPFDIQELRDKILKYARRKSV